MAFSLRIQPDLAKRILGMAMPVVFAMGLQTILNQVDHILVGRLPLEEATAGQSALQASLVILWLVGGSLSAISVGTQAMTARRMGAASHHEAGRIFSNSLAVATVTSLVAAGVSWILVPHLAPIFMKEPSVVALGVPYLKWRMLGVVSMVTTASCKSWFDGIGRTRLHLYAAIVMNVVNFGLAYGLVFGKLGMPRMGVEGVGVASMVSSFVGLFMMLGFALGPRVRRDYHIWHASNLNGRIMKEIVKLSAPGGLATVFVMSGVYIFFWIVTELDLRAGHGPLYAGATANVITIALLTFMISLAFGTGTATLVSQSLGAKRPDLAADYGWEAVKIGVYFFSVVGIVVMVAPAWVLSLWTRDPRVVEIAIPILRLVGLMEPCIVAAFVLTQALFGAGNTRFVMVVEFVLHFTCLVPLAYLFGLVLGFAILGVFAAAVIYIVLLMVLMGWKFRSGDWKAIQI